MSRAVVKRPSTRPTIKHQGEDANFLSSHHPSSAGTPIIHGIASASPTFPTAWRQLTPPLCVCFPSVSLGSSVCVFALFASLRSSLCGPVFLVLNEAG